MKRLILSATILALYVGFLILIAPLSLWMLFNAQTWIGRGLSIAGLFSLIVPHLAFRYFQQERRPKILGKTAVLLSAAIIFFLTMLVISAPSGQPGPDSPVQHRYFRNGSFGRFSLTNIIPESEQVNLGFLLMTSVDPYIDREQSNRVSKFTMDLYHEMEQDKNFHELGSAMGLAYRPLYGRSFDVGHYYLYVPQNQTQEPRPALVFLHGSAGNFKTYTWIWSKFAEKNGFVIIAPSYGFGSWDQAGVETVIGAIEDARTVTSIDPDRIYLAGLSNGGLGVSWTASEYPDQFKGLIFLSPVFNTTIVDSPEFLSAWAERPILIISGEADRRIPIDYVRQRAVNFSNGRILVTTSYYPNEDHFLTFSQPQAIMADVAIWIKSQAR